MTLVVLKVLVAVPHAKLADSLSSFQTINYFSVKRVTLFLEPDKAGREEKFLPCKKRVAQNTEAFLPSVNPQRSERALCFGSLASQIRTLEVILQPCDVRRKRPEAFAASVYALPPTQTEQQSGRKFCSL